MIKPRIKPGLGTPYGGLFELNLPEKGIVGYGQDFETMLRRVIAYRQANGLPVGLGVREEVEAAACAKYASMCYETDDRMPSQRRMDWTDVLAGTKVMIKFKLAGSPLVPQEEADRRSNICLVCPHNQVFTNPCGGVCGALKELVEGLVGAAKTPNDQNLHGCQVCGCYLSASVWLPLDIQTSVLTEDQRDQFRYARETSGCWKAGS